MYAEVTQLYNSYIKFLYNFKLKSQLLSLRMTEVSQKLKVLSIQEILATYEGFDALLTEIFNLFEHQSFCKRTRLFSNIIYLLFQDLIQIYKVFYILVAEILERFSELNSDHAKKAFVVYQNFVNLTGIVKGKGELIMREFGFTMKMPNYYTPDIGLVENLRICVEQKQSNPQKAAEASQKLRGGMDRNQFQTNVSSSS